MHVADRWEDVRRILRDERAFRPASFGWSPGGLTVYDRPGDNGAVGRFIGRVLSAGPVAAMEPFVRERATSLVAAMASAGGGDVLADLAAPLAAGVVVHLLGLPGGAEGQLVAWSASIAQATVAGSDPAAVAGAAEEVAAFLRAHDPGTSGLRPDDWVTGGTLVIMAGTRTTRSLIATAALAVVTHPRLAAVAAQPGHAQAVVEEALRWGSPVGMLVRRVATTSSLNGCPLPEGSAVAVDFRAANRDPDVFDDPAEFRLGRPAAHLSFGAGRRACPGAAVARLEAKVALEAFLATGPWQLDGPVTWEDTLVLRGPAQVPVRAG